MNEDQSKRWLILLTNIENDTIKIIGEYYYSQILPNSAVGIAKIANLAKAYGQNNIRVVSEIPIYYDFSVRTNL